MSTHLETSLSDRDRRRLRELHGAARQSAVEHRLQPARETREGHSDGCTPTLVRGRDADDGSSSTRSTSGFERRQLGFEDRSSRRVSERFAGPRRASLQIDERTNSRSFALSTSPPRPDGGLRLPRLWLARLPWPRRPRRQPALARQGARGPSCTLAVASSPERPLCRAPTASSTLSLAFGLGRLI